MVTNTCPLAKPVCTKVHGGDPLTKQLWFECQCGNAHLREMHKLSDHEIEFLANQKAAQMLIGLLENIVADGATQDMRPN